MASFSSKKADREGRKPKSFAVPSGHDKRTQPRLQCNSGTSSVPRENIGVSHGLYNDLPSSLEIREDSAKGRGIWSRRTFRRGSVLVTHRPYVSVLSTLNLPNYCSFCTAPSKNEPSLKRCTKCKAIWYCSTACQNADWVYHRHECAAIIRWVAASPEGSPPGEAVRSLGRILWGRKLEGEASLWWKEIQALQSHRSSLPPSAVESHTQLAHALVRYLGVTSPVELSPYGLHSAGDLVDLISRFTTNTFTLSTSALTPLGTCVSPLAALFNHSCLPNAVIVFPHSSTMDPTFPAASLTSIEPTLHVIALKDILPGEEVLTSYIDTTLPTSQRRAALEETYNFICTCPLCSSDNIDPREALLCSRAPACSGMCPAPLLIELEAPAASPPRCTTCQTSLPFPTFRDIEGMQRIGQEALDKATSLQFSDPTRALTLASRIITLLDRNFPPSSHPLLALLRLHQSLLVTALAFSSSASPTPAPPSSASSTASTSTAYRLPPSPTTQKTTDHGALLDTTILATARTVSALTMVFDEGHPVRGLAIAELGKLLAVDEPAPAAGSTLSRPLFESTTPSPSGTNFIAPPSITKPGVPFPPTGPARLALAIDTLKRALKELMIGFGESTGGGEVGRELRDEIVRLEKEMSVWSRGVRNAWEDLAPLLKSNNASLRG